MSGRTRNRPTSATRERGDRNSSRPGTTPTFWTVHRSLSGCRSMISACQEVANCALDRAVAGWADMDGPHHPRARHPHLHRPRLARDICGVARVRATRDRPCKRRLLVRTAARCGAREHVAPLTNLRVVDAETQLRDQNGCANAEPSSKFTSNCVPRDRCNA